MSDELEQALYASEALYRSLIERMPGALYALDQACYVTFYNDQTAEIWGRKPCLGEKGSSFCGSHKLFYPDGSVLPHDKTPMAADAILSFAKDAQDIMNRLRDEEGKSVSPIDLHILEVQLHLLGQEVTRCKKRKLPLPATDFPPFTGQNDDK